MQIEQKNLVSAERVFHYKIQLSGELYFFIAVLTFYEIGKPPDNRNKAGDNFLGLWQNIK